MASKSDNSSYGSVAVTIHWVSALAIIALLISGYAAGQISDPQTKATVLRFHAPLGVLIAVLTLARILWWWRFDTRPAPTGDGPAWQTQAARTVHILFYVLILGMAASGIGMFVLSGAGPILFGSSQPALPDFHDYLPRVPHGLGARAMAALFIIHAGAALYHHLVRRDVTLKRMWFSRPG